MTVADYLAHFLQTQGVSHVFGLPGGENVPVIEALRRAGVAYVLVHHEAAAGFAADVTGQLTGRPGVCMSTIGPGAINLLATVAGATLERSPVLAITAEIDAGLQARVTHMRLDLPALFGAATKGTFCLRPATAVRDIAAAWELASAPPRGAAHLAISPETAMSEIDHEDFPQVSPEPPKVENAGLAPALPLLRRAKRLFLLAGLGVEAAAAQASLLALAEAWQAPVAVTPKAKGHFPESHPLFAGCFTAYGDKPLRQALATVDLILGVGLDGVDLVTSTWDPATPVINLALANAADPVCRPVVAVDGDLVWMLAQLQPLRADVDGPTVAARVRQAIAQALITPWPEAPGTIKLGPLIAALREALPPEGVVTVDVGAFKLLFLQQWPTDRPKSLFVANGLSAMGYAVPGAVAVKLVQPERPVVAVVGDGALLMYAGELATVARLGRPLVIVVVVDEALALIRLKQRRQDVPIYGTEFGPTDYQALASAFGLAYRLIDGQQNATAILRDALAMNRPTLVEARIHKAEYDHFK
jgi:acetolactate synthase-1/2/3 large subunit